MVQIVSEIDAALNQMHTSSSSSSSSSPFPGSALSSVPKEPAVASTLSSLSLSPAKCAASSNAGSKSSRGLSSATGEALSAKEKPLHIGLPVGRLGFPSAIQKVFLDSGWAAGVSDQHLEEMVPDLGKRLRQLAVTAAQTKHEKDIERFAQILIQNYQQPEAEAALRTFINRLGYISEKPATQATAQAEGKTKKEEESKLKAGGEEPSIEQGDEGQYAIQRLFYELSRDPNAMDALISGPELSLPLEQRHSSTIKASLPPYLRKFVNNLVDGRLQILQNTLCGSPTQSAAVDGEGANTLSPVVLGLLLREFMGKESMRPPKFDFSPQSLINTYAEGSPFLDVLRSVVKRATGDPKNIHPVVREMLNEALRYGARPVIFAFYELHTNDVQKHKNQADLPDEQRSATYANPPIDFVPFLAQFIIPSSIRVFDEVSYYSCYRCEIGEESNPKRYEGFLNIARTASLEHIKFGFLYDGFEEPINPNNPHIKPALAEALVGNPYLQESLASMELQRLYNKEKETVDMLLRIFLKVVFGKS